MTSASALKPLPSAGIRSDDWELGRFLGKSTVSTWFGLWNAKCSYQGLYGQPTIRSAEWFPSRPMSLSVIIASYNSHDTLRRCLHSLSRQPAAKEIVVADCSPKNPADELKQEFPEVRFLHFSEPHTIPQMRWAAYGQTTGKVVAATEGRCVPAPGWCEALLQAHAAAPEAPAVGGPIALRLPASAFDLGVYFCEYGWHCPPPTEPVVRLASGANISYKREALDEADDLVQAACWETQFHERWLKQGLPLRMANASVTFENHMGFRDVLRQRFHYGRGYGADRVQGTNAVKRAQYALFCPLLPLLMSARLARVAARRGHFWKYVYALPWILFLSLLWSAGEMTGYLFGHSAERKVF